MRRVMTVGACVVALVAVVAGPAVAGAPAQCGDIVMVSGLLSSSGGQYKLSLDVSVTKACRDVSVRVFTGENEVTVYGGRTSKVIHVDMAPLAGSSIDLQVATDRRFGMEHGVDWAPDYPGTLGFTAPATISFADPAGDL